MKEMYSGFVRCMILVEFMQNNQLSSRVMCVTVTVGCVYSMQSF